MEAVEAVSEIFARLGRGAAVRPTRLIRDPRDPLSAREDPTAPYLVTGHIPEASGAAEAVESTRRALWHLQAFGLGPVGNLQVQTVAAADWESAWKDHYAPQRIGRLLIVPSWIDEAPQHGEVCVRLDPGMAFGTGLHPTTRGCLQLMQDVEPLPDCILDVGSGSGILSLAALRLGAGRAVCYDTDPLAVAATQDNARVNGLADRLEAHHGTLPASATSPTEADAPSGGAAPEQFGLVMANLVASLLVELAPRLAEHTRPGGTLIAGGVLADRGAEVTAALRAVGLATVQRLPDGDWLTLRLERRTIDSLAPCRRAAASPRLPR